MVFKGYNSIVYRNLDLNLFVVGTGGVGDEVKVCGKDVSNMSIPVKPCQEANGC